MANKIKLTRGKVASMPTLEVAEPGFTTDNKNLVIGSDSGNVIFPNIEQVHTKDEFETFKTTNNNKINAIENGKQDKLVAGENITIDENNVISASGGSGGGINDKIRLAYTSTPASSKVKIVNSPGFSNLIAGDLIYVMFQHGNTAENINLNIEGTGNQLVADLYAPEGWQQISSMGGILVQYRDDDGHYFQPISALSNIGDRVDTLETSKQDKLIAGANITINPVTNVISASGTGGSGEIDPNSMAYFDYAGRFYGAKYSLFANAWQDMKNSETVLFDIPLALAASNQEMGGMTVDLYVGTNGQLQALYDACVNGTIRPPVRDDDDTPIPVNTYYVNNVAAAYIGDVSGDVGFPVPIYNFGLFHVNSNASFLIADLTPLGMGLGIALAKIAGVSIPNNNIVIQQGFKIEDENGIIMSNSVTSIGRGAFIYWYSNNQPLVIPNSVTSIEYAAFLAWTSNNQPLVIPNSVTSIGEMAFGAWHANNQPVVIPESVTSIGDSAFDNWTSAKEFIMESETPPTIASNTFYATNNAPIYVPDESVEAYKTAPNWSDLADRIFPISDRTGGSGGSGGGGITTSTVNIPIIEVLSETPTNIEVMYSYTGDDPVNFTADFSNFALGDMFVLNIGSGSIPISMVVQAVFGKTTLNYFEIIILFRYIISAMLFGAIYVEGMNIGDSAGYVFLYSSLDYALPTPNDLGFPSIFNGINDVNINGATFTVDFMTQCQDVPVFNTVTGSGSDKSVTVETVGDIDLEASLLAALAVNGMTLKLFPDIKMSPKYSSGVDIDDLVGGGLTKSQIDTALEGSDSSTIQLGQYANAWSYSATALGGNSYASEYSTALGNSAYASGNQSTALGYGAYASGSNSIAIGKDTRVTENNVVDFGSDRQVRVNETPVSDRDAVSKKHLENNSTIKEQNKNNSIKFWTGSLDEYDSLSEKDENTLYFIKEE